MSTFGMLGTSRPTLDDIADVLEAGTATPTSTLDVTRVREAVSDMPTSALVTFGDSRTADLLGGDGNTLLCNISALTYALSFAGRSCVTMTNRGIGGQTAVDLRARVADLWDSGARLAIFACGHNDFNNTAATAEQVWADVQYILDGARARGIYVIHLGEYVSLLDTAGVRDKKAQLNRLAQSYWKFHTGRGQWYDVQGMIVDPQSGAGQPRAGTVRDGTHYGAAMAQLVGRAISDDVKAHLPASSVYLASSLWDDPTVCWAAVNRAASPLSGAVWSAVAGAPVLTAPARADGFGTDVQAVFTGQAGVCQIKRPLDTAWLIPGSTYRIAAQLSLSGPVNVAGMYCQVNWYDGANWHVAALQSNYTTVGTASDVADMVFESAPVTFPGATFAEVYFGIQASKGEVPGAESGPLLPASGTIRLGRFTIA